MEIKIANYKNNNKHLLHIYMLKIHDKMGYYNDFKNKFCHHIKTQQFCLSSSPTTGTLLGALYFRIGSP